VARLCSSCVPIKTGLRSPRLPKRLIDQSPPTRPLKPWYVERGMSFRKCLQRHDNWKSVVAENSELLEGLPIEALKSEAAFRSYVTRSTDGEQELRPSVFDLDAEALERLWTFINHKVSFDMDAGLFDAFNQAYGSSVGHR
jgi:hypothetical protein